MGESIRFIPKIIDFRIQPGRLPVNKIIYDVDNFRVQADDETLDSLYTRHGFILVGRRRIFWRRPRTIPQHLTQFFCSGT